MNKRILFTIRILMTLLVTTLISFGVIHYAPGLANSLLILYALLLVPTCPGIAVSFWYYSKGSLHGSEKPEIPLKSEDEIFDELNKEKKEESISKPSEPEIIGPSMMIVPYDKPGEAIKVVMQNKVIEALSKCKCTVDITADMSLEGEFKDPKITVAFLTPENNKPTAPTKPEPKPKDPEQLTRPRV